MTVAVPSTAPVAARPTTCEVPEWERPPGLDAAPQSVPAAVVTRACEELGARARRLARAPVPTSWRAAHEEVLEARAELGEDADDEGLVDPLEQIEALRVSGRCVVAGAGAWAIEPLAESFDEDETYVLRARVVHVDDDGTMRPSAPFELRTGGDWTPGPVLRPVFDFDADGRVEASLQVWDAGEHTRLFTATGEGVREIALPLTVGVAHWIDFDADGRPDLLADRLFTESECYEWSTVWGMPSLLLHSGPGLTFSADDTVARRYAAEVCPCAPTRLLAPARHGVD
jgi:hypothetical protein